MSIQTPKTFASKNELFWMVTFVDWEISIAMTLGDFITRLSRSMLVDEDILMGDEQPPSGYGQSIVESSSKERLDILISCEPWMVIMGVEWELLLEKPEVVGSSPVTYTGDDKPDRLMLQSLGLGQEIMTGIFISLAR